MESYLENQAQRTKIVSSYSFWHNLIQGVSQNSILGSLLFDIFIKDMFALNEKNQVYNFTDDRKIHSYVSEFQSTL